ncbi:MAG TPA: hypothetical protein V6C84_19405 [Coleofasciculaceae cyanobacterium]
MSTFLHLPFPESFAKSTHRGRVVVWEKRCSHKGIVNADNLIAADRISNGLDSVTVKFAMVSLLKK